MEKFSGVFGKKTALMTALILLVTSIVAGVTFAGDTGSQAKELSLQQAVDLAMENNYDIKLANLDVQSADNTYKGAKDAADDLDIEVVKTYELGKLKWVAPRQAQMGLTLAKEKAKVSEKSTRVAVEGDYYSILKAQKLLEVKQETLKYAKDQLKLIQESYRLGTVSKGDVIAVEALVAGSEAGLTSAQNDYALAVMKLNEKIGLDIDTKLKLTDKFTFVPMGELEVNEEVYKALVNNIEIISVREMQEVKAKEFEVAKKFLGGGVTDYENAKISAETADIKVRKQEVATRLAVKQDYMKIKALEKSIVYKQKEVEKQKEVLRIDMLKFKAGMVTNQDVKKATLDYEDAEQGLAEQIYTYNQLKSKFKYGLFVLSEGSFE